MNTIDLTPLYRSIVGYDRLASMLNNALNSDATSNGYPPYNIEMLDENQYAITLALAGFHKHEVDIVVEKGVLTVRGQKAKQEERKYLHQGIAYRSFERRFNLADHVEVTAADLSDGLLTISLVKEIPEAMKPRTISISEGRSAIEHDSGDKADAATKAA